MILRCTVCGNLDDEDAFGVIGADDGNVFCNVCGCEVRADAVDDDFVDELWVNSEEDQ